MLALVCQRWHKTSFLFRGFYELFMYVNSSVLQILTALVSELCQWEHRLLMWSFHRLWLKDFTDFLFVWANQSDLKVIRAKAACFTGSLIGLHLSKKNKWCKAPKQSPAVIIQKQTEWFLFKMRKHASNLNFWEKIRNSCLVLYKTASEVLHWSKILTNSTLSETMDV